MKKLLILGKDNNKFWLDNTALLSLLNKIDIAMTVFFTALGDLFTNVLFVPFSFLAEIELDNWWAANVMTWLFAITGLVAFTYWMTQLSRHDRNGEEDKSISAHSYL